MVDSEGSLVSPGDPPPTKQISTEMGMVIVKGTAFTFYFIYINYRQHSDMICISRSPIEYFICTFEDSGGPACLHLSQGDDGSQGMYEAHHSQRCSLQAWRKDMLVQREAVALFNPQVFRQEWEIIVIAGGKHHHIHLMKMAKKRVRNRRLTILRT